MEKPKSVNVLADELLAINGPAAIVGEEWLRPVGGHGSVIFPPSYAGARPREGTYNIDDTPSGKTAIIDSFVAQSRSRPACAGARQEKRGG